jgi:hypothetical protein
MVGETRNTYAILIGKSFEKYSLGSPRTWVDRVKTDLMELA